MTMLDRLMTRAGGMDKAQAAALLADAEGMILACTGRTTMPAALETAQVQLAAILYNRQGTEGETAHSEGGVSRTMESMPEEIWRQIAPYRLARVVKMHATESA